MPTSESATPKPSRTVEWLASVHPAVLLVVIGAIYGGLDLGRRGPGWEWLREHVFLPTHVAATVNGIWITRSQLDLAVDLSLATQGHSGEAHPGIENAVLQSLIQSEQIRQAAAASGIEPPAEWIQRAIEAFEAGFTPGKLPGLLQAESLTPGSCREILTAHLTQVHWLDQEAKRPVEDAKPWFHAHSAQLADPEAVRARQIFLSTVEVDTPERESLIRDIHRKLTGQEATFAQLAAQFSEDERTKATGGDLCFFSRDRLPLDFTTPVFKLSPGQLSQPFRTSIGWHIVEITGKVNARPAQWPDLRAEVELHLRNEAKRNALEAWWQSLDRPL